MLGHDTSFGVDLQVVELVGAVKEKVGEMKKKV